MAQNRTWTITQSDVSRTFTISPGVGQTGPAGPSNITTATETDITGILKGDGANVSAAVEDTDYQGVPAEGAFIDGDKTKLDGIEAGADVTDATNVDAAGAVMESDYSPAHSVLAQQSGTGSPSSVTLGTDSLLGRASGAGTAIQGLTAAQARTLLNVEDGATADQTGAEIKSLYEAEADTNAFTDAEKSKLAGIEAGADVTDAANVDAAGAVMETDLQSDIQANPSAPLKGDGSGSINVSYLGLETYILGGPVAPSGTPSWNMPNVSGVLANATNNDGEVGANGIDFAGSTDIGADLADADEILVSVGGGNTTRVKSALSRFWTYIKSKIESIGLSSLNISGNLTVDTTTLHVDSANNRVGVGTNTPSAGYALDVSGNTKITGYLDLDRPVDIYLGELPSAPAFSGLWFGKNSSTATASNYSFLGDPSNTFLNGPTNLYLRTGNITRATIDADGIEVAAGDSISFTSNSGTWDGATIAGDQTMSGQVELTGQAASTDDSAMTRSLGDARYGRTQIVRKALSEQKTNDATPSADAELTLPVEANSTYEVELVLPYLCDGGTVTQGLQLQFGGPTGWTMEAVLNVGVNGSWLQVARRMRETSNFGVASGNTAAEANFTVNGTIKTSTTAGSLDVEWAQNTASANRTQVRAGAFLKLTKIS